MFASEEVQKERLKLCNDCEFYSKLSFCMKCNCFMPAKVKFAGKSCPIGLWNTSLHEINKEQCPSKK
jgi:hypothetical protein